MSDTRVQELLGKANSLARSDWARLGFTLCLFGLPLIMGWFAVQQPQVRGAELFGDKAGQTLIDRAGAPLTLGDIFLAPERPQPVLPSVALAAALSLLAGVLLLAFAPRPAPRAYKYGRLVDPAAYSHCTIR